MNPLFFHLFSTAKIAKENKCSPETVKNWKRGVRANKKLTAYYQNKSQLIYSVKTFKEQGFTVNEINSKLDLELTPYLFKKF